MGASSIEPVIFDTVIHGARKAFDKVLTPQLLAQLRGVGMDFDTPLPAYPMEIFLTGLALIAEAVAPGQPADAQHRQLGREFMYGYVLTPLGFATLTMGKVIGVKRTLLRFGRALKTTGNYADATAEELGPTEVQIVTQIVPEFRARVTPRWKVVDQYRIGVIEAALDILKVDPSVVLTQATEHEAHFRVAWKPR